MLQDKHGMFLLKNKKEQEKERVYKKDIKAGRNIFMEDTKHMSQKDSKQECFEDVMLHFTSQFAANKPTSELSYAPFLVLFQIKYILCLKTLPSCFIFLRRKNSGV